MAAKGRAEIEITASSSRLASGLAAAGAKFQSWAGTVARGIGGAFKRINKAFEPGDMMKNAGGHFLGEMGARGTDAIVDAAKGVRDFERNLVRLQITTNGNAATTAALRKEVLRVSAATGIARDEVLAGASSYVALTGDAAGATTAMATFARIAQASGSSVEDVATASAALQTSMGIKADQMEAAFSGLVVQGKAGAVELKDMAAQLAPLLPQFAQFRGGKNLGGLREMGAAFQVIRTGAGGAGEAATQFESLMGELTKPEVVRKLAALKINVFDKDPQTGLMTLKNASQLFEELAANQKLSDPRVVAEIFGRKEAQQALRSIRNNIASYRDLTKAAEDTGAVQRDLNTYLESDSGKLDTAMNNLKLSIAAAFTPERIRAFTAAVEAAAEKLGPLLSKIGMIGDALGAIGTFGQKVRGVFDHVEGSEYSTRDMMMSQGNGMDFTLGADNSEAARKARVAGAKSRLADVDAFNKAKDAIMGSEANGASSPASINAAFAAKYNKIDYGKGHLGAEDAGRRYLRAAGVQDPVEVAIREMAKITAAGEQARIVAPIAKAIKEGLAGLQTNVAVDGNNIAKAAKGATNARRGG